MILRARRSTPRHRRAVPGRASVVGRGVSFRGLAAETSTMRHVRVPSGRRRASSSSCDAAERLTTTARAYNALGGVVTAVAGRDARARQRRRPAPVARKFVALRPLGFFFSARVCVPDRAPSADLRAPSPSPFAYTPTVRLVVSEPVVSCSSFAAKTAGRTRITTRRTSVRSGRSPSPDARTPRASSWRSSASRRSSPTPPFVSASACSSSRTARRSRRSSPETVA